MNKKDRDEFQRGRESMHSEMESLRALARRAGEALRMLYLIGTRNERENALEVLTDLRAAGLLDEGREGE